MIRNAQPHEAKKLSNLALRSKAYWGYTDEFMEKCKNELVVSSSKIISDKFNCVVIENQGEVIGYYALEYLTNIKYELEALFVEPKHIGLGIGKLLITHAKKHVASLGGKIIIIQGDPNATAFYLAIGAIKTGEKESLSISGRFLPMFEILL